MVSYIAYSVKLFIVKCDERGVDIVGTYEIVKNRILRLCEEENVTINKLATESGVAPSTIKNILYGKSKNPGIVTLKMLCDGLGITLNEFFDTKEFKELEQEI